MSRLAASLPGVIPVVGPIIQAVISEVIPNVRADRVETYIHYLQDQIDELKLERVLKKPEGQDFFEEGLWQSARAFTDERRQYIGELVVSGLKHENTEQNRIRHYLRILNQIGDEEIIILSSYQSEYQVINSEIASAFWKKHCSVLGPFSQTMDSPDLPKAAHKDSLLAHLASFGLLKVTEEDWQKSNVKYALTNQGKTLLGYIGILQE